MSMLDSFFKKGFNGPKCKTLLKLTIPRIKLLRNRREIQIKQMRRDIAKLLENGQEATARIRVEHIIREENMMAAQEIIELFCELIAVRLPIIETQRECPLDLKEAISSICFAAPRCADLTELLQVQMLFASKYGREFVVAATELMPDCGVNRQIIELLSVRAPSAEVKLKLLKEIAEEHNLEWDPAASETELFKSHEDLLNGPAQFVSGSQIPLPEEKHESMNSTPVEASHEQSDSDPELDSLDFPEVPKVSVRPTSIVSPLEMLPFPEPNRISPNTELENDLKTSSGYNETVVSEPYLNSHKGVEENAVTRKEEKQFLPFIAPPSVSSSSFSAKVNEPDTSLSRTRSEIRYEENIDLQDVLAAAQAAADSAERAAKAARSAASLAQIRIMELTNKRHDRPQESNDHLSYTETADQSVTPLKPNFDHQKSFGYTDQSSSLNTLPDDRYNITSDTQTSPSYDSPKDENGSVHLNNNAHDHQPKRLTSLDEDPYFSYPNLFVSQSSKSGSATHPSADNSPSAHDI